MSVRFVCLANSYKEGGRCLAGIVLDNNNNPVLENGRRKWIRPICPTPHGEVHTYLVCHINILDIVEIEMTGYPEERNYQSENVLFKESSIKVSGRFYPARLDTLCENRKYVFGTTYSSVNETVVAKLTHSLLFIKTTQFEIIEKIYADSPDKLKIRLVFSYNGIQYDFSVTDPAFIHRYQRNPEFLESHKELYLTLSLGVKWPATNRHYKLVAGVIHNNATV